MKLNVWHRLFAIGIYDILQPAGDKPRVVKPLFYDSCINQSRADNKKLGNTPNIAINLSAVYST
jgi:hypothetical protein